MKSVRWPILLLLLALATPGATHAADWPQFRGPHASGLDTSAALPVSWNMASGSNVLWKTALPGMAHAAPIVWGDRD